MTTTRKLVLEGPTRMVEGFVAGVLNGSEKAKAEFLFWAEREGFQTQSFVEQLSEWVGLKEHLSHLVLDQTAADHLVAALNQDHGLPIRLRLDREVEGGSFEFRYEVFAPVYAKTVQGILKRTPKGVVVEGMNPEIEQHPDAKGTELYSPDHHWAERAEGKASGPFPAIAHFYKACVDEQLIRQEALTLQTKEG